MTHLRTSCAMRLRENSRSASATLTFLPRMRPATRLSFCGEILRLRATALASLSPRLRMRFGLPISPAPRRCPRCSRGRRRPRRRADRRRFPHRLAVAAVAVERPGRRELAELVPDHVLIDRNGDVLAAVVDAEGEAHE